MKLKILAIGDIIGRPGRDIIKKHLRNLIAKEHINFTIANAENVSGGSGIMPKEADELFASGLNVLTGGDHIWSKKEIVPYIYSCPGLLRPANYPEESPGKGFGIFESSNSATLGVIHVQGRTFMKISADCPFKTAKKLVDTIREKTKVIVVDMHAEATSEKVAFGWYLDGLVSFVFGTHTHIQTADERILPNGTAYITDLGMTGPHDSVIGRRTDRILHRFLTQMPAHYDVATGDIRLSGAIVTIDSTTGRAEEIRRVMIFDNDKS